MQHDETETAALKRLEETYWHQFEAAPKWLGIAIRAGWIPIVEALFQKIDHELSPFERRRIRWVQVKQKVGELRVYYHVDGRSPHLHVDLMSPQEHAHLIVGQPGNDQLSAKIDGYVKIAAQLASKTCEVCGGPGVKQNASGHIMVACPKHLGR
jgi:hypothetical protein